MRTLDLTGFNNRCDINLSTINKGIVYPDKNREDARKDSQRTKGRDT